MRELLQIHIGKAGNSIGNEYWNLISQEHNLTPDGTINDSSDLTNDYKDVLFNELSTNHYSPRAILLDTEPTAIESLLTNSTMRNVCPDNIIYGMNGTGNCWARGFGSQSRELMPYVEDSIRKEVERCDSFQGFQIFHAISGGTGGGLCSAVQPVLHEMYPNAIFANYTLIPAENATLTPFETYNSTFSMENLINYSHMVISYDNNSLYYLCEKKLNLEKYSFDEVNKLIAMGISDITSTTRFHSENSASLRKIATNLVEYPYHHFFLMTNSQLDSRYLNLNKTPSTLDIIKDITNFEYTTCYFQLKRSKEENRKQWLWMFCLAFFLRGNCSYGEIIDYYKEFTNTYCFYVAMPCHSSCYISHRKPIGVAACGTSLNHNKEIGKIYRWWDMDKLQRAKPFFSYYKKEGITKEYMDYFVDEISSYASTYDNYGGPQIYDRGNDWENTGKRLYTEEEERQGEEEVYE